ncbi:MAG TPA: 3-isopropylmalate dehydratase small subunit [Candidatus Binatia bacterium]|jgi:3-isopropylmalate/(R)-2-methylmalate dehydratase small subunit
MDPFVSLDSLALPFPVDNVDTDVITPLRRILEGTASMVEHAFESLRFAADGTLKPDCALNSARWKGAEILLAGHNFGCGSSRETAVWAVRGMGFRCIIAPSFGDIFRSNCFKNGLLPVVLDASDMATLVEEARGDTKRFRIDLENCCVTAPSGRTFPFDVGTLRREILLEGLDDLALALRRGQAIERFEEADRERRPWVYL